jgi:uncharacterized protein involved in exopolysaccharide biosynthesis
MSNHVSQPVPSRSLELSQKLYERLLAAYPRPHREEYGGAMMQLFRDQCRDAWADGQTWGLVALWLRTLPDLVKTSFIERWSNFNPGKYMSDKLNSFFKLHNSPSPAYMTVFIIVFLLVFSTAVIITFLLPVSYASTARIKVEPDQVDFSFTDGGQSAPMQAYDPYFIQTTFQVMQSQIILSNVVAQLNLNASWGRRYYGGQTLKTAESAGILKRRMDLKPVRDTKLISITVFSDEKNEAAQLANAIAKSYADYRANAQQQRIAAGLRVLEQESKNEGDKIEQLQADKDALAQKYGIVEGGGDTAKNYQNQLIEGARTTEALKTQLTRFQALDKDRLRDVLPTITGDGALSDLLGKLNTCEQTLAGLTNDYAPADLHIARVASTINELNREIDARVAGIMVALDSEVASKQAALASLQASVSQAMQNNKPSAENQPYWDKKRELDHLLDIQRVFATKIAEEQLEQLNPPILVEITDLAEPGHAPIKPNKPLNIVIGAIGGVLAGSVAGSFAMFIAGRARRRKAALPA